MITVKVLKISYHPSTRSYFILLRNVDGNDCISVGSFEAQSIALALESIEEKNLVIYKPTKSAMQSGLATNKFWILKYVSYSKTNLDPLMGWSGSDDTSKQIVLKFNSKEEAIDYAELHSLNFRILNNNTKTIKPKSYADNFSFKRKGLWSH